jgi:hypothetical protein
MDNGTGIGGCSMGKSCDLTHPKMCHQSLGSRSCSNIKDGARCSGGYYVRGTKFTVAKPPGGVNKTNSFNLYKDVPQQRGSQGSNRKENISESVTASATYHPAKAQTDKPLSKVMTEGEQQSVLNSVFSEIIRAEVMKLLQTGNMWPQPVSHPSGPVVSPPVLRGQGSTTTTGSLGALLSLLGAQHHQ